MKSINPTVYKELSHKQRAEASYDAILRNDVEEMSRLMESCEQKTYQQPEHQFTDMLIERITSATDLTSEKQIEAIQNIWRLNKRRSVEGTNINVTTTVIHKRSADWPPEDITEGHIVSNEFISTRNTGK